MCKQTPSSVLTLGCILGQVLLNRNTKKNYKIQRKVTALLHKTGVITQYIQILTVWFY